MSKQFESRKGLIVGIIAAVMLLVVLAVTMAACNNQSAEAAPTTQPTVAADSMEGITIYWNVDRAQYDGKSEAGMSSRSVGSDGYFHIRFFKDGKFTELLCTDRKMVNTIDVNDLIGVRTDENGVITEVFSVNQLPVEKIAWKFYVQSVGGNTVKANSSDKFNGLEVVLKLPSGMKVYDMTGTFGAVGEATTAAVNDRIMALSDLEGNLLGVYIYDRSNMIIKTEAYCQHCDEVVTWQEWKDAKTLPKETPQITHFKLVTDVQLSAQQSMKEGAKICLDLNGHRVDGADGKRVYSVHNLNGELAIMDTSEGQTGVIAGHGDCTVQGVCIFIRYGAVYLYSGTIDASDVTTNHSNGATAVYVAAQRFFYMNGGEIIGGTAVHQYNAETKKYSAGMGATIFNKGKVVINDGIIRDGYAKSVKTVSNGKVTYQRGIGGNYFGSSGSMLEINGGQIRGGVAGTGGNIFLDGTAEMILNNGVIYGGRATDPGRNAGNIYVGAKATLTMNCGTIFGGITKNLSGNIHLLGTMTMSGGVIYNGKCLDANTGLVKSGMTSYNMYVGNGARFTLYGGKIYGGVAAIDSSTTDGKKTYVHLGTKAWLDGDPDGNNFTLMAGAEKVCLTVGPLLDDASVGVTASGIFTAETAEKNLDNFHTDVPGAEVLYVDNCLAVGRMACLCGSEEHFGECDGTELLWGPWTSSSTLPSAGGNYYLVKDVTRTASSSFGTSTDSDFTINLDLNGKTVTCKQRIGLAYANMNIVDHAGGGVMLGGGPSNGTDHTGGLLLAGNAKVGLYGGTIALREDHYNLTTGGVFGVAATATLNVYGGTIDGSNAKGERTDAEGVTAVTTVGKGGAIRLSGTMTMTGGTIIGGETNTNGGAIFMEKNAVLNLNGGTVTGGTSVQGGNIYLADKAVLNLAGGTVTDGSTKADSKNSTSNSNGGNIYAAKGTTVTLSAGAVKDGFSVNGGGNIYTGGNLTISGGKITGGNSSNYVQRVSKNVMVVNGNVTMTGGEITGHVALVSNGTPGASFTVSGKPVLAGGEYNLRLVSTDTSKYPRPVVTVEGVLEDGAKIVINESGVVSGVTVQENVKAFDSTDPLLDAILNEDSCIALGYVHCLCSQDTHESWCDGKDLLWEPWDGKSNITKAGNYYLSADVTDGSQRSMGQNGKDYTINLDLNGKTYASKGRSMLVYADLNIVDSIGGGTVSGKGPNNDNTGTLTVANGSVTNLYQGTLTVPADHNNISYGGVVGIAGKGEFILWPSGTIDGSKVSVTGRGGAVRLSGKMTIKGGNVIGGDAQLGGAIAIDAGGELTMTSGSITGGKATAGSGGNIAMYSNSKATISGGTISGGEAKNVGGNIYLYDSDATKDGAELILTGDAVVSGGKTTAGGSKHGGSISMNPNSTVTLEGNARVEGGESAGGGGNFYVAGTLTIRDNAVVTGGTAKGASQHYGNNILVNSGTLNLEGGVVEGYISAVNVSDPVNCFINISGSPEVNKGTTNLRLTYTNGTYPKITVSDLSGEGKVGIRLENKSAHTIDGVSNTGLFVANADGASEQGEKFFFADAPTGGQVVLMEDGLNIHGEGYRVACACGGRLEGSAYHSCSKVTWKPWKTDSKLPTEGYYYLSTDISNCERYNLSGVTADRTVGIDLNGHDVTASSGYRIFQLYDGNVTDNTYKFDLIITDNGDGSGKLIPADNMKDQGGVLWITEKTQTVSIFGGHLDGSGKSSANDNPGMIVCVGRGTLNIFGGTVTGGSYSPKTSGKESLGGAIGITYNHNGGTVNMYGGTIVNGSADKGDAVYVDGTNAKFNIFGGNAGNVYTAGNGVTVGGTATLDLVIADGKTITVADDLNADEASITVTMAAPGVFAENVASDVAKAFISADKTYGVRYTDTKTLELFASHVHCWCVEADVIPEGHTCSSQQIWKPISALTTVSTNKYLLGETAETTYIFLDWATNSAKSIDVAAGKTAYLCLNGKGIYATNTITVHEGATLYICDCSGDHSGKIFMTGSATNSPVNLTGKGTVNLMSGSINPVNGSKNIHAVTVNHDDAVFNMYGGKVIGGKTTGNGANINLLAGSVTLLGGTVSGGSADGLGNDIYVGGGSLTVGSKAKVGELYLPSGKTITVNQTNLGASVGIAMEVPGDPIAEVTKDVSSCFTSVDSAYIVGWKNGALVLGVKADHQHCFCENAEALPAGHKCDTLIAWTAVEKKTSSATTLVDGGHYYLNWTGASAQSVTVADGAEAWLCLNGATIYAKQAVTVGAGSTLHICDCSSGKTGMITVSGSSTDAPILLDTGVKTVNLYSGTISGSGNGKTFVSVKLSGGTPTFHMYGGQIADGYSTANGGNVQVTGANAKFYLHGGTITGGEVADGKHGGNVFQSKGQFVMYGGKIVGGSCTAKGGNVMLLPNGTTASFTMNGGVIESGSAANGGNIAVNATGTDGAATFTMNGGTVKGGTATTAGENLYLYSSKDTVIVNAGSIIGGTVANAGGGTVTVNGGTVDGLN